MTKLKFGAEHLGEAPEVLVVKLSAMGDIVHAMPAVAAFKRRVGARITWAVDEGLRDLLADHPVVDEILVFPRDPYKRSTVPSSALRIAGTLVRELRSRRFQLAVDLQGLFRSWVVLWLARARWKIGVGRFPLVDRSVPHRRAKRLHAVLRCCEAFQDFGIRIHENSRCYSFLPQARKRGALFPGLGDSVACLVPYTTWSSGHWSPVGWAKLADWFIEEGFSVVLLGGEQDRGKSEVIRGRMAKGQALVDLCGSLRLSDLSGLFRRSRLVVGVDTGPLHIAAATSCPTVGLFGPTDPVMTGPFPKEKSAVCRASDCRHCRRRKYCGQNCLQRISFEEVRERVEELLARVEKGGE